MTNNIFFSDYYSYTFILRILMYLSGNSKIAPTYLYDRIDQNKCTNYSQ